MPSSDGRTAALISHLRNGSPWAREALINHANDKLLRISRSMLRGFPGVKRWEQTDDVCQNVALRLHRVLSVMTPESPSHFWNLAGQQTRRELIRLARHYQGPLGQGKNHHTERTESGPIHCQPDSTFEPSSLAAWTQFHEQVNRLPETEREVFHLRWYEELTNREIAERLGMSERSVKRYWLSARLMLGEA